ncbi:glycoside hydrolase family 55 protein [Dothistroma septosporum NZE10]|uniref:Glycoside hydrolase family 55 protein n=1 Tax=Dothistroma septosporum (strain NZE10 / CBS 128990) TaxID=675120 RepID=N1PNN6_DOTSN|nr:glycoside hydrolase family 55 protein [Dothistroma septosporum NZE10]
METIKHQGIAAFNSNPSGYQVFRNVKDFGAKGDGVTDDAAAINRAISSGGRCGPGTCASTTTTPAVVYFPAGTYMVNSSIIDYYYTQLIGNPNCLPTIKAFPKFTGGLGVIDGDQYGANGLGFGATNVFWRQIRNFIIDTTLVPASSAITGIHWPTAQATSIQNVIFQMSNAQGTQHQGIFIESGSGGFLNDLKFYGGLYGGNWGNQQFTMRNLTFDGVKTAMSQIWDWGWTYKNININNCSEALNLANGGSNALTVGSVTFLDSTISNTPVGFVTGRESGSQPATAGSIILENIKLSNVPVAVQGPNGPLLQGTNYIAAWGQGNSYTPNGPNTINGQITANSRPSSLLQSDGKFYERSKPQYEGLPVSSFLSARTLGATGNGKTDDTKALQAAITQAKSQNKILYLDHGDYLVTSTIYIPAGSKIVGETYSVILSSGAFFNSMTDPKPVLQVGKPGESGSVELSDFIVSTQGQQAGAVLFEINIASPSGTPTGLWDVHARIGGFAGSNLQVANCPTTPKTTITSSNLKQSCISGFITCHITKSATGIYLENNWLWTADHDVDDASLTQITVYAGRGLLDESAGPVWLVGTAVEHHSRYEYQFANAKNVFQGQIQTETAYYQNDPWAKIPFPYNATIFDPTFPNGPAQDGSLTIPGADGFGLRIYNSQNILTYGAGLYSFFLNYNTTCSDQGQMARCQSRINSIEGTSSGISIYNLNTVGTHWPITVNGTDVAKWSDDQGGFIQTIALFRK